MGRRIPSFALLSLLLSLTAEEGEDEAAVAKEVAEEGAGEEGRESEMEDMNRLEMGRRDAKVVSGEGGGRRRRSGTEEERKERETRERRRTKVDFEGSAGIATRVTCGGQRRVAGH
jgi:hypothetical protein